MIFRISLLCGTLLMYSFCAFSEVTWVLEQDTLHIENKPQKNFINLETLKLISAKLSIQTNSITASAARALELLEEQSSLACVGNLLKTNERASKFPMTNIPQVVFPGLRLYSHRKLSDKHLISLQDITQENLILGILKSRNYGFSIEEQIRDNVAIATVYPRTLSTMFEKKRFGLIIEYPTILQYFVSEKVLSQVYSYKLSHTDEYSLGYIACSNTKEGEKIVEDINRILSEVTKTNAYVDVYKKWFQKEEIIELYNNVYQTNF